ncbi:MAG: fatty acid desaturase [Crocosphaera sp.]
MKTVELNNDNDLKNFYLSKLPKEIFDVNPTIYWLDFLTCASMGWTAFILLGQVPFFSIPFFFFYVIAIFSIYRAGAFVHEVCHQQYNHKFAKGFVTVWHILIGLPLLFPAFYYDCHLKHHDSKLFKTSQDPHYPPVKSNSLAILQMILLVPILMPLQLLTRFFILTPLSRIFPSIRETVERKFSSMTGPDYVAKFSKNQEKQMLVVELVLFLWLSTLSVCFVCNIIPLIYLFLWYFVSVSVWVLNFYRVLLEHGFDGWSESPLTLEEQILDSYTYPRGGWRQLIFAPGARYHALHHIFPTIPYHNLPIGHEILKENLPESDLYLQTEKIGCIHTMKELFQKPSLT